MAEGKTEKLVVTPEVVREVLGVPKYRTEKEVEERVNQPGVSVGLVWTPVGGDIVFIEASRMRGGKQFTMTGHLGEVMQESMTAALTWVRSNAERYGIDPDFFRKQDIHIHVPSGAVPKDGPSAGVAMVTALVSLLSGRLVRPRVAMTGEISLSGVVLPVGGDQGKGAGRKARGHPRGDPAGGERAQLQRRPAAAHGRRDAGSLRAHGRPGAGNRARPGRAASGHYAGNAHVIRAAGAGGCTADSLSAWRCVQATALYEKRTGHKLALPMRTARPDDSGRAVCFTVLRVRRLDLEKVSRQFAGRVMLVRPFGGIGFGAFSR